MRPLQAVEVSPRRRSGGVRIPACVSHEVSPRLQVPLRAPVHPGSNNPASLSRDAPGSLEWPIPAIRRRSFAGRDHYFRVRREPQGVMPASRRCSRSCGRAGIAECSGTDLHRVGDADVPCRARAAQPPRRRCRRARPSSVEDLTALSRPRRGHSLEPNEADANGQWFYRGAAVKTPSLSPRTRRHSAPTLRSATVYVEPVCVTC